jgi:hypothetical protein
VIRLDESIRAVYYIAGPLQDYLAGINEVDDGKCEVYFRFRYYDLRDPDNDAYSDRDRKSWHAFAASNLDEALSVCQRVYDELLAHGYAKGGRPTCKLVRGKMSLEEFSRVFMRQPFVHARAR